MKFKLFFIAILFAIVANSAQAQEKNYVLKNTFKTTGGQLIVADVWNELRISDLSYETIKTLMNTVESLSRNLQQTIKNLQNEVSEQKQTIKKLQNELYEQKRKLDNMEIAIRDLKNKVK
jgi:peptidoglycan hydrolase CwlO-like protein